MSSVITYFGGKHYLAPWIISLMPKHKCYVEVFGGAGHVLFAKEPIRNEVFNDKDDYIVNLFKIIRDRPNEFLDMIRLYPYSRTLHNEFAKKYKDNNPPEDPLERAVWYFYLNRSSFTGQLGSFSGSPKTSRASDVVSILSRLSFYINRLREVIIECLDYKELIEKYDWKKTLFYCDPPYVDKGGYRVDFSKRDHIELASVLKKVDGKVVLSYGDCPLVRRLYQDWTIHTREATQHASNAKKKSKRTELVLRNV